MSELTFFWHDYETFGIDPRRDRPSQFAGIRTDAELNEIGDPLMIYCQPANDYLPDPQACLVTGITPQRCLEAGLPEHEFAAAIEREFATPGTVGVGYNTIRFDDEFTRFLFWRNLIDPYAREWQNDCGRWDLLDVVRTTHALRPDGIDWPVNDEGRPSFRLEHLSAANGLIHESAHDALSDVRATIALARLIRQKQPRLFDFCLKLRRKEAVQAEIGLPQKKPFLHVSGMFAPERGCLGIVWPLGFHPTNRNELIVWDLEYNPAELSALDAATVRQRLFSKKEDLPEGVSRLPVKTIHINKSPIVIGNLKTLSPAMAQKWQIDIAQALQHAEIAARLPDLSKLWIEVYQRPVSEGASDVDADLYGGFIGNSDRRLLDRLRSLSMQELADARPGFEDGRLDELWFRYRARNHPHQLSEVESAQWQAHCAERLHEGKGGARTLTEFFDSIDALSETADERAEEILGALYDYAEEIAPELP